MKTTVKCEGWWRQYGKQERMMLELEFDGSQFTGTGEDIIGKFIIVDGNIVNRQVTFSKQYVGAHEVIYVGETVGDENQIWKGAYGFRHGFGGDQFEIQLKSSTGEIQEIRSAS